MYTIKFTHMQMHTYNVFAFIIITCMGDLSTYLMEDNLFFFLNFVS